MGYIWLQETGAGFGADVDYVLNGSAARASAELIRYRNQQSVHMREDRIVRILSGPAEAAASAHSEKIPADRPAALILLGISDAEAHADDAALKHGELANLASIHAAAYKASAIVGQFKGDTAVIVPACSQPPRTPASEPGRIHRPGCRQAPRHQPVRRGGASGPGSAVDAFNHRDRGPAGLRRRVSGRVVATVDDFEVDILFRDAVDNFTSSTFRHRSLSALLREGGELAETLQAYFEASLDVAGCAARMRMHKNTVYYRISKAAR